MDRRKFLTILSGTVGSTVSGGAWATGYCGPVREAKLGTLGKAYTFFNDAEVAFIEAAIARLIPSDALGSGALEADVGYFLDRELSGPYGTGAKAYLQGPWGESSRFQGYQLALTPQQLYRVGIAATDRYCKATHSKTFAEIDGAKQDEVLRGLQGISGDVDLRDVPAAVFFDYLLRDTKDGFFADPIYGGNKDMVSWRLVGYPGVSAVYTDFIFRHNEPYNVQPVGIHEMQHAQAPADRHGHAMHRPMNPQDIPRTAAPSLGPGERRRAEVEKIDPLTLGSPIV
jgi:gluconate 2-dehydrogenase gamma chain